MKTLVLFLAVVAMASAQQVASPSSAPPSQTASAKPVAGVGGFPAYKPVYYGPKVYGEGALNQFALPPNPFSIKQALAFVKQVPGTLVRLDLDGDITITDRFGQEIETFGHFGQEIDLDF